MDTVPGIVRHHTRLQAQHRLIGHSHPSHFVVLQILHITAQNRLSAHRHADIRNWLRENRLLIIIVICVSFWTACNKLEENGNVLGVFLLLFAVTKYRYNEQVFDWGRCWEIGLGLE